MHGLADRTKRGCGLVHRDDQFLLGNQHHLENWPSNRHLAVGRQRNQLRASDRDITTDQYQDGSSAPHTVDLSVLPQSPDQRWTLSPPTPA